MHRIRCMAALSLQALSGSVVRRGDPAYDEARALWNGVIDRRPEVVVRCANTQDVVACVRHAKARGCPWRFEVAATASQVTRSAKAGW